MQLPFLQEKSWPRSAPPMEEKHYGLKEDDQALEEHCFSELREAIHTKNITQFRQALEALVMGCFDDGELHESA